MKPTSCAITSHPHKIYSFCVCIFDNQSVSPTTENDFGETEGSGLQSKTPKMMKLYMWIEEMHWIEKSAGDWNWLSFSLTNPGHKPKTQIFQSVIAPNQDYNFWATSDKLVDIGVSAHGYLAARLRLVLLFLFKFEAKKNNNPSSCKNPKNNLQLVETPSTMWGTNGLICISSQATQHEFSRGLLHFFLLLCATKQQ